LEDTEIVVPEAPAGLHPRHRSLLPFPGLACGVGVSNIYYNQPLLLDMARTLHTDHIQIRPEGPLRPTALDKLKPYQLLMERIAGFGLPIRLGYQLSACEYELLLPPINGVNGWPEEKTMVEETCHLRFL
jgi:hypothetical protein